MLGWSSQLQKRSITFAYREKRYITLIIYIYLKKALLSNKMWMICKKSRTRISFIFPLFEGFRESSTLPNILEEFDHYNFVLESHFLCFENAADKPG
jgi:hypothetical protein